MSDTSEAEVEALKKIIRGDTAGAYDLDDDVIARAILAAGYARRSDTLEEAARIATLGVTRADASHAYTVADRLRSLARGK